ncbi:MAG: class I SAM-dependent methyltransferase [Hyphomicrobiaceae bacterium]
MKTREATFAFHKAAATASARQGWIARAIQKRLSGFGRGRLTLTLPDGSQVASTCHQDGPRADIKFLRWRALARVLLEGDLGLASSWISGDWTTSDLSAVFAFGIVNEDALVASAKGMTPSRGINRIRHGLQRNSKRGSRRNISMHYDLGNAFYEQWLDDGMQYSSAIFSQRHESLEEAQAHKLSNIAAMMNLPEEANVLEIGCGWGAVAEYLAREGHHVTGLTLSREQAQYARKRLSDKGLAERASIEVRDYRDIDNTQYDRIVSIEMLEAVGVAYWPVYFSALRDALTDTGNAVVQVITIGEEYYERYRNNPDFIQMHVFPGGMLPTKANVEQQANRAGLTIVSSVHFGDSYRRTLAEWRNRFHKNWAAVAALGFDERFRRMWDYYLRYCEAGFQFGTIDVGLYKFVKEHESIRN